MLPATDNLALYRGDTVRERRYLENPDTAARYDLTGCTATAQVRATDASAEVLYTLECTLTNQGTDPGGIIMVLDAGLTDDAPPSAVWDWQIQFPDGSVRTYGAGTVAFSGQVTRPVTP